MDAAPSRREQNMARWNFTGYLGALAGTLAVVGSAKVGSAVPLGWRGLFAALTGGSHARVRSWCWQQSGGRSGGPARRQRPCISAPAGVGQAQQAEIMRGIAEVVRRVAATAGRRPVAGAVRDVRPDARRYLLGFMALYFVDVAEASEAVAAAAGAVPVSGWSPAWWGAFERSERAAAHSCPCSKGRPA